MDTPAIEEILRDLGFTRSKPGASSFHLGIGESLTVRSSDFEDVDEFMARMQIKRDLVLLEDRIMRRLNDLHRLLNGTKEDSSEESQKADT